MDAEFYEMVKKLKEEVEEMQKSIHNPLRLLISLDGMEREDAESVRKMIQVIGVNTALSVDNLGTSQRPVEHKGSQREKLIR